MEEITQEQTTLSLGALGVRHGDMLSLTLKKSASAGSVPDPTLDDVDRCVCVCCCYASWRDCGIFIVCIQYSFLFEFGRALIYM